MKATFYLPWKFFFNRFSFVAPLIMDPFFSFFLQQMPFRWKFTVSVPLYLGLNYHELA